jgi:putative cardiolipin synthase
MAAPLVTSRNAPVSRLAALLLLLVLPLAGCASLPSLDGRSESVALADARGTPIHDALDGPLAAHPGLSGIYVLRDGEDAFAARIAMIDAAARSLDLQYYIWHDDLTGQLMFDALHRAAGRGVRIRLLLDDNNTKGLDATLAALDAHPQVEVRLFNPFMQRRWRPLGYLVDFSRLNRRMHNKSLTADGAATIIGGRNIGDEYFAAGDDVGFVDLDIVAVGPVVRTVAKSFDDYWRCDSAYPVERLLPPATAAAIADLAQRGEALRAEPRAARYLEKVATTRVMRDLVAQELPFEWAVSRLVVDDPSKGLGKADRKQLLSTRLSDALGGPATREFAVVSPYFVPGRRGTKSFKQMAESGVKVKILTNALESTDVAAVHSGYAKRRRDLLKSGVELYEMRRDAREGLARRDAVRDRKRPLALGAPRARRGAGGARSAARAAEMAASAGPAAAAGAGGSVGGSSGSSGGSGGSRGSGSAGSSDSSLHAKTFAVDAERIFIGSFNFDPRSAIHNTELGLVIDSPSMASALSRMFLKDIPEASYQVQFDAHRRLQWLERRPDGTTIVYHNEPRASLGRRLAVTLFGLLPIEGLL